MVYIGQTGCFNEMRIKEHHQHIKMYHLDKSAVAKHRINLAHHIQFQDTRILPAHEIQMRGVHHQLGNRDQVPSQQYEQGRRFLPE
jgi:hypothetical protein